MTAGNSNVSKYKNTTNVAWSPPQKENIMPRAQWHNRRTQTLLETGEDIGPWPGNKQKK